MKPYRTLLNKRQIVDKAIDDMFDAKIIRRSNSPWSFPIVVVDKKDGSKRFCVDFRQLNKVTKFNSYPLPLIDDILALLGGSKYFTTLDLKSGYWQVLVQEKDKEKTAYLDDVLIHSATLESQFEHIQKVYDRLKEHGLKLKLKKCSFLKETTRFLGFTISTDGVSSDPSNVSSIRSLPAPSSVKEVRSFLGMCSYYRRFIPPFLEIAIPLIHLTKKYAKFKWTDESQKTFDHLKQNLTCVPLLGYPDTGKPYVLYTDASDKAIGACLVQEVEHIDQIGPGVKNEKPIYFLSHKSTVEKEAFAIHYALQKLDHYLHNATFVIKTDHKPLNIY